MALLIFNDIIRRNIAKWVSFVTAFILIYASLFQKANYNLILGMKILDMIPLGIILGIIFAYFGYLYHTRGLL